MENWTAEQRQAGEEIQTIIRNFNKDSPTRKTTKEYFASRLNRIEAIWKDFEARDEEIRLSNLKVDDEYFTSSYFNKIKEITQKYRKIFKDSLAEIETSPSKESLTNIESSETKKKPEEKTTPEGKVKTPEGEEQTSHEVLTLMRRQKALMNSLARLINGRVKEEVPIQCLEAMNKLWSQIEELHYSIWEKCENPLTEGYDMNSYSEFEIKILKNRSSLKGPTNNTRNDHLSVQLPKMTIPKFDGDYLKWQTFSDIFTKMIHHQDLPQIQKMWYLKTNVSGDAERLLRHLELTEENYTIAWKTLQDRFSNKRAQTLFLIQKILGLPQQNSEVKTMREFHDTIHESLAALKALSIDTDSWAPLLIHLLTKKLDRQSHLLYEQSVKNPRELPTIEEFLKFLKSRFEALEAVGGKDRTKVVSNIATSNIDNCKVCGNKNHPIFYCERFLKMSAAERLRWTQRQRLCVNCFRADHTAKTCVSRSCSKCTGKHNTLLHLVPKIPRPSNAPTGATTSETTTAKLSTTKTSETTTAKPSTTKTEASAPMTVATIQKLNYNQDYVLLATARVIIAANNGQSCVVRAILDSGSQINLVSERLIKRLSLSPKPSSLCIEGIGRRTRSSTQRVNIKLQSSIGKFNCRVEAFILPSIVSPQPTQNLDTTTWSIPENINLADPNFHQSDKIDVLLGAELYHQLIRPEQIRIGDKMPLLQNTVLGWVVAGKIKT